MIAPMRLSASMFSRCISLSGVSRDEQHKATPLLQGDIGRSRNQFVGISMTDGRGRCKLARGRSCLLSEGNFGPPA